MKRLLGFGIFLLMICCCLPTMHILASEWGYRQLADGSIEIISYSGTEKEIEIPAEIDGKTVSSIGNEAFCFSEMTSITIPDRVTHIGDTCFFNCKKLTQIVLPESVSEIGGYAFTGCISLKEVTLADGITRIGDSAFANCKELMHIEIPGSVSAIGNNAFTGCVSLAEVTLADGVSGIGNHIFDGCSSLEELTIPGSVGKIGSETFSAYNGQGSGIKTIIVSEGRRKLDAF